MMLKCPMFKIVGDIGDIFCIQCPLNNLVKNFHPLWRLQISHLLVVTKSDEDDKNYLFNDEVNFKKIVESLTFTLKFVISVPQQKGLLPSLHHNHRVSSDEDPYSLSPAESSGSSGKGLRQSRSVLTLHLILVGLPWGWHRKHYKSSV